MIPQSILCRSETAQLLLGWRQQNSQHSLPEAYSTVDVPSGKGRWFSKLGAFFGVGFMVAVGYMDPGMLHKNASFFFNPSGLLLEARSASPQACVR